jgi:hypothetical protein
LPLSFTYLCIIILCLCVCYRTFRQPVKDLRYGSETIG